MQNQPTRPKRNLQTIGPPNASPALPCACLSCLLLCVVANSLWGFVRGVGIARVRRARARVLNNFHRHFPCISSSI